MPNDCPGLAAVLDAYAGDQEALARHIEDHCAICPDCHAAEDGIERLLADYRQRDPGELSPDLEAKLQAILCAKRASDA